MYANIIICLFLLFVINFENVGAFFSDIMDKKLFHKYKAKWMNQHSSIWATEDCESIVLYDDLSTLYDRLVNNKEWNIQPPLAINLEGPLLADFEAGLLTIDDHHQLIDSLITTQHYLACVFYSNTPFSVKLSKQCAVLHRIYYAIFSEFHICQSDQGRSLSAPSAKTSSQEDAGAVFPNANMVLVEFGVKTGLSMIFALFRQNWTLAKQLGQYSLTNEVLETAITTVSSLPPLSLAFESKLSPLGIDALNEITQFLRSVKCFWSINIYYFLQKL